MTSNLPKIERPSRKRWPSLLAGIAGLLLLAYFCIPMVAQYHTRVIITEAAQLRLIQQTAKRASILSYYFDLAKAHIETLAGNSQIRTYLLSRSMGASSQSGMAKNLHQIKTLADQWVARKPIRHQSIFDRILIADIAGRTAYDSENNPLSSEPPRTLPATIKAIGAKASILPMENRIVLTVAIQIDKQNVGHIAAWLNTRAILSQLSELKGSNLSHFYLITRQNGLILPEILPSDIAHCQFDHLFKTKTTSHLAQACTNEEDDGNRYLATAKAVDGTPLYLLCVVPASKTHGILSFWKYYIIMALIAVTLVWLYFMHIGDMRRNVDLKTFYKQANQQKEDVLHKNITLANEIRRRRVAEHALKSTNENLEVMVKKRTATLDRALNDLRNTQSQLVQSGKLASIGELAAGVAHELNQPLMVIRGNVQMMRRAFNLQEKMIDQFPELIDTIERNTKRMILIIDHLRCFSRQSMADFQKVDINQAINDAFLMIGEQLRLHNIEAVNDLAKDLPKIFGAPYQLEQVFLNMITNARDAIESYNPSSNGGNRHPRRLEIITRLTNGNQENVEILFKDSGCGISPKNQAHLFDPFFTTKAVGKGTGLGLSLSYGILKDHGGHINVLESRPGQTVFCITLPVSTPEK